jgi:hypothetical protein
MCQACFLGRIKTLNALDAALVHPLDKTAKLFDTLHTACPMIGRNAAYPGWQRKAFKFELKIKDAFSQIGIQVIRCRVIVHRSTS